MSNYTAGPWQVQDPSGLLSVQIVKQPDKCICSVYKLFFEDAEALANARLMAAGCQPGIKHYRRLRENCSYASKFSRSASLEEIDHGVRF